MMTLKLFAPLLKKSRNSQFCFSFPPGDRSYRLFSFFLGVSRIPQFPIAQPGEFSPPCFSRGSPLTLLFFQREGYVQIAGGVHWRSGFVSPSLLGPLTVGCCIVLEKGLHWPPPFSVSDDFHQILSPPTPPTGCLFLFWIMINPPFSVLTKPFRLSRRDYRWCRSSPGAWLFFLVFSGG